MSTYVIYSISSIGSQYKDEDTIEHETVPSSDNDWTLFVFLREEDTSIYAPT